jgi:hypothetical protein
MSDFTPESFIPKVRRLYEEKIFQTKEPATIDGFQAFLESFFDDHPIKTASQQYATGKLFFETKDGMRLFVGPKKAVAEQNPYDRALGMTKGKKFPQEEDGDDYGPAVGMTTGGVGGG